MKKNKVVPTWKANGNISSGDKFRIDYKGKTLFYFDMTGFADCRERGEAEPSDVAQWFANAEDYLKFEGDKPSAAKFKFNDGAVFTFKVVGEEAIVTLVKKAQYGDKKPSVVKMSVEDVSALLNAVDATKKHYCWAGGPYGLDYERYDEGD